MGLWGWLSKHGVSLSELARRSGVSYTTVFVVAHGHRVPTYATARAISDATKGIVSVDAVFELHDNDCSGAATARNSANASNRDAANKKAGKSRATPRASSETQNSAPRARRATRRKRDGGAAVARAR